MDSRLQKLVPNQQVLISHLLRICYVFESTTYYLITLDNGKLESKDNETRKNKDLEVYRRTLQYKLENERIQLRKFSFLADLNRLVMSLLLFWLNNPNHQNKQLELQIWTLLQPITTFPLSRVSPEFAQRMYQYVDLIIPYAKFLSQNRTILEIVIKEHNIVRFIGNVHRDQEALQKLIAQPLFTETYQKLLTFLSNNGQIDLIDQGFDIVNARAGLTLGQLIYQLLGLCALGMQDAIIVANGFHMTTPSLGLTRQNLVSLCRSQLKKAFAIAENRNCNLIDAILFDFWTEGDVYKTLLVRIISFFALGANLPTVDQRAGLKEAYVEMLHKVRWTQTNLEDYRILSLAYSLQFPVQRVRIMYGFNTGPR